MKRRIECLFVAVVMICMFLGSSTVAFAENQSTNNIGAINFEKYLNRLPPNLADEIRNDPELVYMMTQDSILEKECSNYASRIGFFAT